MAGKRANVDWERIRAEFEVGGPNNSLRAIAERHCISHEAVRKRRKAEDWPEPGNLDDAINR